MSSARPALALVLLSAVAAPAAAAQAAYPGPRYTREALAPGVWAFVFHNELGDQANVDGTAVVIVNDDDVIVVDAQWTPRTARRVIAEIRRLTPKPVRYVVNTHWHGDHWFGNQAYREAFPGVEFIAHPNTLADLEANEIPSLGPSRDSALPAAIRGLEERYRTGVRRDGKPLTAADSAAVRRQLAAFRWAIPAAREIRPLRPTLLVADSLVLWRGDRAVVIRFLGRGNTRGDLTVWLPREQVLVTGDLLVNPVPYSFGSYLSEWVATLTRLRALPARVIVPGHGAIQRDWAYLDLVTELLRSTVAQARGAVERGLDLAATRGAVDLSGLRARFTGGDPLRERAFDAFFITPAVERAWLEARGETP